MGSTQKNIGNKKNSQSYFKTRQGVHKLQSVSVRPSAVIADVDDPGYGYFSQRPAYGVSYLHAPSLNPMSDRPERQLKSSYIVDEDGAVIKVE